MIIEFDGRHHIERVQQWEADLERREEFDQGDWRILVVTSAGIYNDPRATIEKCAATPSGRAVSRPGRSDAWRAHFPTR